uniref:Uncharacterized protein n=1 Tax=Anguilla anguilla TaxID=7936 RepID=A0A0E9X075_ANGAN
MSFMLTATAEYNVIIKYCQSCKGPSSDRRFAKQRNNFRTLRRGVASGANYPILRTSDAGARRCARSNSSNSRLASFRRLRRVASCSSSRREFSVGTELESLPSHQLKKNTWQI